MTRAEYARTYIAGVRTPMTNAFSGCGEHEQCDTCHNHRGKGRSRGKSNVKTSTFSCWEDTIEKGGTADRKEAEPSGDGAVGRCWEDTIEKGGTADRKEAEPFGYGMKRQAGLAT